MTEFERETTQYFMQKKAKRNEELARLLCRSRSREEMLRLFDEIESLFEEDSRAPVA